MKRKIETMKKIATELKTSKTDINTVNFDEITKFIYENEDVKLFINRNETTLRLKGDNDAVYDIALGKKPEAIKESNLSVDIKTITVNSIEELISKIEIKNFCSQFNNKIVRAINNGHFFVVIFDNGVELHFHFDGTITIKND